MVQHELRSPCYYEQKIRNTSLRRRTGGPRRPLADESCLPPRGDLRLPSFALLDSCKGIIESSLGAKCLPSKVHPSGVAKVRLLV